MSNMRPAGRMRPFASTPAARTKDTVIWSFNGQNCSFYNLNWMNVRRSQKNSMLFFIQNVFYTWKYDRLFPSVKIFIKWLQLVVVCGPHDSTNVTHMALGGPSVWHAWFRAMCCGDNFDLCSGSDTRLKVLHREDLLVWTAVIFVQCICCFCLLVYVAL